MDRPMQTPPELEGVDWGRDDAPRRPRTVVSLVAWLCIIGLVLSVAAGFLSTL